ncbi:ABC transporter ATP-binding protein [Myceligenerans salitolerans]|uniref:ABC transporter ATP-binding protein n=1 Tax=Myceligenerans salitolerans TaxID=1230528 RepID=A0ABS3IE91_9MICO|nr:ABC transporter ATP-binding protein [Myceligenerans salitolerans]MBO0611255.1 ABC transporter ATP-binding protein [Myceligenerans salitolerans]
MRVRKAGGTGPEGTGRAAAERDGRTASSRAPLLEVRDLAVEFRTAEGTVRAVDGLSYRVDAGRTLAVVGESGSGKSVSSLAVMGLLPDGARVSRGQVLLAGEDLLTLSRREHRDRCGDRVAMVFQDALAALNPVHTVGYQLTEALRARRGLSRRDAARRAVELLDLVRVPNARGRVKDHPHQFSGGMRQRVMIAIALAMDPDVLIADEPTTALDVTVQAQVLRLLAEIQAERRMGLVLITHDLGVVAGVADDVTVMYAGRVVERAPVRDTFRAPAHPYTRALLRSIPSAASGGPQGADARRPRLSVIPGRPPSPAALPAGCAFHPRCDLAGDLCRSERPPLTTALTTQPHDDASSYPRASACHFAAEVLASHDVPAAASGRPRPTGRRDARETEEPTDA